MNRNAAAVWHGNLKIGKGAITTESGALSDYPYTYQTRFENHKGTNPEELIAAAHAGCFTMAFVNELEKMKYSPESIETMATVHWEKENDEWSIKTIHFDTFTHIPGASDNQIRLAGESARVNCPISRLIKAEVTLKIQPMKLKDSEKQETESSDARPGLKINTQKESNPASNEESGAV